jgi:hypothetical protein
VELRQVKAHLKSVLAHPSVAASAAAFLDGLLGPLGGVHLIKAAPRAKATSSSSEAKTTSQPKKASRGQRKNSHGVRWHLGVRRRREHFPTLSFEHLI